MSTFLPVIPLFVCHANCCRSVLAAYLYRELHGGAPAFSAGLEPGERINDRALEMLRRWGIDARGHRPRLLQRGLCDEAGAIFVAGPSYLHRLLLEYGWDLAGKSFLLADPFSRPRSFSRGEYKVRDPSFDERPIGELVDEYSWLLERVRQLHQALQGAGRPMIPALEYRRLLRSVDPRSH